MEEYREKTKEELAEENRIEDAQKKLIEDNADDLEFLHKKAEEIFYNESYDEWSWDTLFNNTIRRIRDHHNPASLPVLLRLCDDVRFEQSLFQEGWLNVFAFGYEREDLVREYFKNLHELFPYAPGMGADLYAYCIESKESEREKKYVCLSETQAFRALIEYFESKGPLCFLNEDDIGEVLEGLKKLKKYYDVNRMKVV